MRCLAAGFLGVLATLTAADAAPLWRAERGDESFYLLGSVHVLEAGEVDANATIRAAYANASTLVFELDVGALEPTAVRALISVISRSPDGRQLADLVGPEHWPEIVADAETAGVSLDRLRYSEPWHAAMLVSQQLLRGLGYDGTHGVEAVLGQWAARDAKPVIGLETLSQQLRYFDSLSLDAQRELLGKTLREADELDGEMRTLVSAWRNADLAYFEAELYEELQELPELHDRLLVERNRDWVDRIEHLAKRGDRLLIVVGALHLVGPDSLLAALEARGYRLQKVFDPS
ncbi:MAG: TraB/GumN family protein [Pseudomonadota bacterium]